MLDKDEVQKRLEQDKPVFTTIPEGTLKFPNLNKPDQKYKKWTAKTVVPGDEEVENLGEAMNQIADFAYEQAKAKLEEQVETAKGEKKVKAKKALAELKRADIPMVDDVDDDGEPTGSYVFNPSMPATKTIKDANGKKKEVPQQPGVFDSEGNKINTNKVQIWGGTKALVAVMLRPYYVPGTGVAGCSLRLRGVQVTELVSGGGSGTADSMGFKKIEGGYKAPAPSADDADDDADDDDDDQVKSDGDSSDDDEDF